MTKGVQHACRFLRRNASIAAYLIAVDRNTKLLREVRSALPPALKSHCLHASLEGGVLTLVTSSPVWAWRLRFFGPELKHSLCSRYGSIDKWRVRIRPHSVTPGSGSDGSWKYKLSTTTVQHLIETASAIDDECIAQALRRLAQAGAREG